VGQEWASAQWRAARAAGTKILRAQPLFSVLSAPQAAKVSELGAAGEEFLSNILNCLV
jgi:hypothetical protein